MEASSKGVTVPGADIPEDNTVCDIRANVGARNDQLRIGVRFEHRFECCQQVVTALSDPITPHEQDALIAVSVIVWHPRICYIYIASGVHTFYFAGRDVIEPRQIGSDIGAAGKDNRSGFVTRALECEPSRGPQLAAVEVAIVEIRKMSVSVYTKCGTPGTLVSYIDCI